MKKYVIILSLFGKMVVAQNLSFDEILKLQTKKFDDVEEFLSARNWQFISSELPTPDKMGMVTFCYDKEKTTDKAQSFFYYQYTDYCVLPNCKTRVSIQLGSKPKYSELLTQAKQLGFTLNNTLLEENKVIKVYYKGNTIARFSIQTTKGDYGDTITYYHIMVLGLTDCLSTFPGSVKPIFEK